MSKNRHADSIEQYRKDSLEGHNPSGRWQIKVSGLTAAYCRSLNGGLALEKESSLIAINKVIDFVCNRPGGGYASTCNADVEDLVIDCIGPPLWYEILSTSASLTLSRSMITMYRCRLASELNEGFDYYVPAVTGVSYSKKIMWCGTALDSRALHDGVVHTNRDHADAHMKALLDHK